MTQLYKTRFYQYYSFVLLTVEVFDKMAELHHHNHNKSSDI